MASFGERLRFLRKSKGYSMDEFAKLMNAGKTTIYNWEKDNRFPDRDTLIKLADFFDVSLDYLLGRTDIKNAKIVEDEVDGDRIRIAVDKDVYPDGLTHEQVIEILNKLKEAGVQLKPDKK